MIFWFIGQPGSGKSTLARAFKQRLEAEGLVSAIHLDGDELRAMFKSGYTPEVLTREYREEQTRLLQQMVGYLANQGFKLIVSTVNGFRNVREEFKHDRSDIKEIYVTKSENRGREGFNINGYEEPLENYIHVDTTGKTVEQSLDEIWDQLIS